MNHAAIAMESTTGQEIAIIGMAGRFPGATNLEQFWQNLCQGVESIPVFDDEALLAAGVAPAQLSHPDYVRAGAKLEDADQFDASFFGFTPREAAVTDPQHRLLLECAWQALEKAGYDAARSTALIGVYAGSSVSSYWLYLYDQKAHLDGMDPMQLFIGNDKDFLASRISFKLGLEGPSCTIQTACSTSLVAVHLACQGLLSGECDMALAGGVAVSVPQGVGYLYQPGGVRSPDGHCRAFDAHAAGTVTGNGVGMIALKRLEDALTDGDCIHAVIKASAINNDGALKVSYAAPRIDSQASIIKTAQILAEVSPDTIQYIEAHGTGTPLGDPIELAALTQAFQSETQQSGYCAIGSVKTNIGHLDAAAGIAGLIKTVLALQHQQLPPSLHFQAPNPQIDFAQSPFYVNTRLQPWPRQETPRRAGVSSFGMGGTNAHVILEEAPAGVSSSASRPWQLLVLSTQTATALETTTTNLAEHLQQHPELNLADVAYTLQVGRKHFDHRRMLVYRDRDDALQTLTTSDTSRSEDHLMTTQAGPLYWLFPGQGSQHVAMAQALYQHEPTFREHLDRCCELLLPDLGVDLRHLIYPPTAEEEATATEQLTQTHLAQPALFAVEYALAQLWLTWGIRPAAMLGHSIGEYVAACLAGVFSLPDALKLVVARGQLMQQCPPGGMLSVSLAAEAVEPLLPDDLWLAASNAPELCVVSGALDSLQAFQQALKEKRIACRRLKTSHAFHSPLMVAALEPFLAQVQQVTLQPPQWPIVSSLTGTRLTAAEATDPDYWVNQIQQPVRFAAGVAHLLASSGATPLWLEVGPGKTLSTFVRQQPIAPETRVLQSMRHPQATESDQALLLQTLGQLWLAGITVDWQGFYAHEQRRRLPLPTYPFERQRYWIEPQTQQHGRSLTPLTPAKTAQVADWFYLPTWQRTAPLMLAPEAETTQTSWLVFVDSSDLAAALMQQLAPQEDVVIVQVGEQFQQIRDRHYTLNPHRSPDYDALLQALQRVPSKIMHLWGMAAPGSATTPDLDTAFIAAQPLGFYSVLSIAQSISQYDPTATADILVVTQAMQDVTGVESLQPARATVLGACQVIPQEYPQFTCRSCDVDDTTSPSQLAIALVAELLQTPADRVVSYRGGYRWVQAFEPLSQPLTPLPLKAQGVYLILGGLGHLGLQLADYLARTVGAKLILTGRSPLPPPADWETWLATHEDTDRISDRIRSLQTLTKLGAEVMTATIDITDAASMRSLMDQVEQRFGALHGVIHSAGILGTAAVQPIQAIVPHQETTQFQAKVQGLHVLAALLQDKPLDFVLLNSSISSVLGGIGYAAYAAANNYLDAFARWQHHQNATPWLSVNWDGWQFHPEAMGRSRPDTELAITPREAPTVFEHLLQRAGVPQVMVSTGDLPSRMKRWLPVEAPSTRPDSAPAQTPLNAQPRPPLSTPYGAPETAIEHTVTQIWQDLLGVQSVGRNDNFFDLGGHSLLAIQILSRLRQTFEVELPIQELFADPTPAQLATAIEQAIAAQAQTARSPDELAIRPVAREAYRVQRAVHPGGDA